MPPGGTDGDVPTRFEGGVAWKPPGGGEGGGATGPTGPTGPTGTTGATGPAGGDQIEVVVQVSSAELKLLSVSPKLLIAAPGLGKFLRVYTFSLVYHFGTVAYSGVDFPQIIFEGISLFSSRPSYLDSAPFGGVVDALFYGYGSTKDPSVTGNTTQALARGEIENKALIFSDDSVWTLGDGTITITVGYSIEDF